MNGKEPDVPPDGIYDVTLIYGDVIRNCRVKDGLLYLPVKWAENATQIMAVAIFGAYKLTPVVVPDVCPE